ncbi:MAG: TatD family hydrolase [Eubacteriales bacterium]|nr:TatD family hydrolase [Eubacteriales bacterium]
MIIDFHTHIFPDKVAAKALPKLSSVIHIEPSMNGTADGLRDSMERGGIDVSVVLPTVTDPHQFDSILRFAVQINETWADNSGTRLISLAGMHPICENYKDQLKLIKKEGFKGIKIHPNYQGLYFDDIHYMRLIYAASELGLCVITHTGEDPYTPDEIYCSPDMILHVLDEVAPPKLILAHMGSNENYEEADAKLCGKNVYLDTAYSLMHMPEEQLVRMIHHHGADKVLFGTDAPWTSQKECAEKVSSLTGLSQKEKQQILYENAAVLLGI